ncbi:S4 domain-containing protein YaaA [Aciduricibacillus chroicocephali]|uniref:S4 domain-containing protein YaaA n=1 Tax=Aciduricibacillus chroicocephali TaxID=3054939 RepID=A0ABY9KWK9_9BACI|nr:S4 domain-containing protein YaaA [Bacillaceae bacterium 44XB]
MHEQIEISTEYITLGQFLKLANIFESGGMIKGFLQDEGAIVNGELEHRRGRKLYPGDVVEVENAGSFIVAAE